MPKSPCKYIGLSDNIALSCFPGVLEGAYDYYISAKLQRLKDTKAYTKVSIQTTHFQAELSMPFHNSCAGAT